MSDDEEGISISKGQYAYLLAYVKDAESLPPHALINHSENQEQITFTLRCKNPKHVRHMQLRSVILAASERRKGAKTHELYCKVCNNPRGKGRRGSQHEQRCYKMMVCRFPNLTLCIESLMMGSDTRTPLDLYVPEVKLGICVDGAQHFSKEGVAGHHGSGSEDQAVCDECVNEWVLAGSSVSGPHDVRGLVRLHFDDHTDKWVRTVSRALERARTQPSCRFVVFSDGYERPDLIRQV